MVSIIVSKLEDKSKLDEIKEELLKAFKIGLIEGTEYSLMNLSMIFSEEINGGYKEGDPFDLLLGDSMHYNEEVLGFNFKVSPYAFFQVNTNVFEKMLNEIAAFL
jgi:tRNA/tmRNA/rRNA uracil-C5-methylase (TrmA/RlmC/RlmD family)